MTSLQTHIAQIPGRVRFFLGIGDASGYQVDEEGTVQAVMTSTSFDANTSAIAGNSVAANTLFRDMGKSITVLDNTTQQQIALYRLVQKQVDGVILKTEGANLTDDAYLPFYIKVWDSNGAGVRVVRTG
jgi:hypothetical protein